MDILKWLTGVLAKGDWNIIIYIIIIFVFILGLIFCILPVMDTRRRLKRAARNIRAGQKSKTSWQEDEFLGKGTLMPHWSEYLNNLFFADGVYHNASNVEDYINEDTVIYGPGRSTFADAVPSLLVSLGFLGTLIGLTQGLSGFGMEDSAAVQRSIVTLIPGMRYAFMTSIFGVVGSILFTLITRATYGSTENAIKLFYSAMSRYAGVLSVDPMTQIAIYEQEQTALIQTIAKDLNGAFTKNMAAAVQDAVTPIDQSLKNFITVSTKEQMRFLDAVVMRYMDRMDDAIGGQFSNLGKILEQTAQNQREAIDSVRANMNEAQDAVDELRTVQRIAKEMTDSLSACIRDMRGYQAHSEDAYARMASGIEQMELVSREQTAYLKTVSAMQSEITRAVESMTGAVNGFARKFAEDNATAAGAMQKAAGELRDASTHIEAAQRQAAKSMDEELKNTLDAYREYVNQFTQRVDFLASSISDSLSKMPRAVADTSDRFLDQIDGLSDTMERAQRALNEAVNRLYGR